MKFVKLIVIVLLCGGSCLSLIPRIIPDEFTVDAQEGDIPYIAQINVLNPITGDFLPICAGAIISDQHILTTAVCASPCNVSSRCKVFVGRTQLNSGGVEIGIRKSEWHPSYYDIELVKPDREFINQVADIGILFTSERIEFSSSIQSIALPTQRFPESPVSPVIVAGWGNVDYTVSVLNLFHSLIYLLFELLRAISRY